MSMGMAAKGAGSLLSSAKSGGGGGGGSGGLTPQEMALMEFQASQQRLKAADLFGSHGMGHSTGSTYAQGAAEMGAAAFGGQMADANLAAQQAQQVDLASLAGSVASGAGGGTSNPSSGSISGSDITG